MDAADHAAVVGRRQRLPGPHRARRPTIIDGPSGSVIASSATIDEAWAGPAPQTAAPARTKSFQNDRTGMLLLHFHAGSLISPGLMPACERCAAF